MKIIIDSDVLLDIPLARKPHITASRQVFVWSKEHPFSAAIPWHCVANTHYVLRKSIGSQMSSEYLKDCLAFMDVPDANRQDALYALGCAVSDIDDALVLASAVKFNSDYIVTRNIKDYKESTIPALKPNDFSDLIDK